MSIKRFIIFTKSDDVLKEKQFYCNKRAHFYVPSNLDIYSYFFVKLFFHDCKTILFEKLASFLQFGFCLPQVTFCYQKYSSWRLRIVREGGNQKKKNTVDQIGQGSRKVNKCTLKNEQALCKRMDQKRIPK